jgi:UDP-2,3-diacylglucosamine hydrolase
MQTFNHLITTRPHEVRQVLISDLHLSPEEPALVQAFWRCLTIALPCLLSSVYSSWVIGSKYG